MVFVRHIVDWAIRGGPHNSHGPQWTSGAMRRGVVYCYIEVQPYNLYFP